VKQLFADRDQDTIFSVDIISALTFDEESEWSNVWGKPLDQNRLAKELRRYGVRSANVRINNAQAKGYQVDGEHGLGQACAWRYYLNSTPKRPKRPSRPKPYQGRPGTTTTVPAVPEPSQTKHTLTSKFPKLGRLGRLGRLQMENRNGTANRRPGSPHRAARAGAKNAATTSPHRATAATVRQIRHGKVNDERYADPVSAAIKLLTDESSARGIEPTEQLAQIAAQRSRHFNIRELTRAHMAAFAGAGDDTPACAACGATAQLIDLAHGAEPQPTIFHDASCPTLAGHEKGKSK